jgi:hypothetical protein
MQQIAQSLINNHLSLEIYIHRGINIKRMMMTKLTQMFVSNERADVVKKCKVFVTELYL